MPLFLLYINPKAYTRTYPRTDRQTEPINPATNALLPNLRNVLNSTFKPSPAIAIAISMYAITTIYPATTSGIIPIECTALIAKNPKMNQGIGRSRHDLFSLLSSLLPNHNPIKIATGTSIATRVNFTITAMSTAVLPPGAAAAIT